MDYFKVKTKHVLYSKHLSDKEFRAWISCMAITAHLEECPTHDELTTFIHPTTLSKYVERQNNTRTTYDQLIAKVLEDVSLVQHKRTASKATSQINRDKFKQRDTSRDEPRDKPILEKRREEKIKEDNTKSKRENKFSKPSREQVEIFMNDYSLSKQKEINAVEESEKFINHYTSNGWKVGKNAMKDWGSTARGWIGRLETFQKKGKSDERIGGIKKSELAEYFQE